MSLFSLSYIKIWVLIEERISLSKARVLFKEYNPKKAKQAAIIIVAVISKKTLLIENFFSCF